MRSALCLLVGSLFLTGLIAQGDCPNQVAQQHSAVVDTRNEQACSTGINGTFHGVHIQTPVNRCPLLVIITPAYASTESRSGCGTLTEPAGLFPVMRLTFACTDHWLLGIIPIIVSSSCVKQDESTAGSCNNYQQRACRQVALAMTSGDFR